ncbi:hypothetical protein GWI33_005448 [Rhynchophorus ferrugineus]|uniref:Uncharacterized protein n=1 Tax=Rhynchophorus ferrugineus TaxID=354439 RepID=A0A834ILM2_RHYFE|nr:hypothetical protein GWI33_005448 [Rhynchophorus ferrugineus]
MIGTDPIGHWVNWDPTETRWACGERKNGMNGRAKKSQTDKSGNKNFRDPKCESRRRDINHFSAILFVGQTAEPCFICTTSEQ